MPLVYIGHLVQFLFILEIKTNRHGDGARKFMYPVEVSHIKYVMDNSVHQVTRVKNHFGACKRHVNSWLAVLRIILSHSKNND